MIYKVQFKFSIQKRNFFFFAFVLHLLTPNAVAFLVQAGVTFIAKRAMLHQ